MKSLKSLVNKNEETSAGQKRVKLPSGQKIMMPKHVSDYIEPGAVKREEFNPAVLNEVSYQHNYIREVKKRDVYVEPTVQMSEKPWTSRKVKR